MSQPPDQLPPDHTESWSFPKPKKTRKPRAPPRTSQDPRTGPLKSVDEIRTEYQNIHKEWSSSTCLMSLRKLIASQGDVLAPVKKAICLGIGSFDPEDGSWDSKRRTYHQCIAFLAMVEELEKFTQHSIECIFQEPLYTPAEKTFLTDLGHTVVNHPVACAAVTSDSLVYGVHLYRELYAEALQPTLPAMFVGTDWETWDALILEDKKTVEGIKVMQDTYRSFPFPEDYITFTNTAIYWRPRVDGGKDEDEKGKGARTRESEDGEGKIESELVDKLGEAKISCTLDKGC